MKMLNHSANAKVIYLGKVRKDGLLCDSALDKCTEAVSML